MFEGTEFNTVKTELHWVSSIKQILQNFEFIITAYMQNSYSEITDTLIV